MWLNVPLGLKYSIYPANEPSVYEILLSFYDISSILNDSITVNSLITVKKYLVETKNDWK